MIDGWTSFLAPLVTDLRSMVLQKESTLIGDDDSFSGLLSSVIKNTGLAADMEGIAPARGEVFSLPGGVTESLLQPQVIDILALLQGVDMEGLDEEGLFTAPPGDAAADDMGNTKPPVLTPEMEALLFKHLSLAIMKMVRIESQTTDVPGRTLAVNDDLPIVADIPGSNDDQKLVSRPSPVPRSDLTTKAEVAADDEQVLQVLALLVFNSLYSVAPQEQTMAPVQGHSEANPPTAEAQTPLPSTDDALITSLGSGAADKDGPPPLDLSIGVRDESGPSSGDLSIGVRDKSGPSSGDLSIGVQVKSGPSSGDLLNGVRTSNSSSPDDLSTSVTEEISSSSDSGSISVTEKISSSSDSLSTGAEETGESTPSKLDSGTIGGAVDGTPPPKKVAVNPIVADTLDAISRPSADTLVGQINVNQDPWGAVAANSFAPLPDPRMAPPPVEVVSEQATGNVGSKAGQTNPVAWQAPVVGNRLSRSRGSLHTPNEVEKALQNVVAALRSGDDGEELSDKPPAELRIAVTVSKGEVQRENHSASSSKPFSGSLLQGQQPTVAFAADSFDTEGEEKAVIGRIEAGVSTRVTLNEEDGDIGPSHDRPKENVTVPRAENSVLSGRDMTSVTKEDVAKKGGVFEHRLPVGAVERFERIIDQLGSRTSGHDLTVRLSIGDEENVVLGLKDLGTTVTIEVKASHQGIISLLQNQKDAIVRHLEGKDIRTSIFIDPNASGTPDRRERREGRQSLFTASRQEIKGFGEFLEVFA